MNEIENLRNCIDEEEKRLTSTASTQEDADRLDSLYQQLIAVYERIKSSDNDQGLVRLVNLCNNAIRHATFKREEIKCGVLRATIADYTLHSLGSYHDLNSLYQQLIAVYERMKSMEIAISPDRSDEIAKYYDSMIEINARKRESIKRIALNEELTRAVWDGKLEETKQLLDKGADVNARHSILDESALTTASENGDLPMINLLLDRNADIHASEDKSYGTCALSAAVENGHLEAVKLLLNRGANIEAQDSSAIYNAVLNNDLPMITLLLDRSADIHAKDNQALCIAAERGYLETVKLLLDRGADIHANGEYALIMAAENGHLDTVKLLLDRGADIHARDDYTLLNTVREGNVETVAYLLERGANIHTGEDAALYYAVDRNNLPMIKLLLDRGADIHAYEDTALIAAAVKYNGVISAYLLDRGANIYARDQRPIWKLFGHALHPPFMEQFPIIHSNKKLLEDPMVDSELREQYKGFVTAVKESMGKHLGGLVLHYM